MVICSEAEKTLEEGVAFNKITRDVLAFILNLFPGLGFYFSGTVHNLKRLRVLGVTIVAAFLFVIPVSAVIVHPHPLMNYHFTTSDLLLPSAIAFISAISGTIVEHQLP